MVMDDFMRIDPKQEVVYDQSLPGYRFTIGHDERGEPFGNQSLGHWVNLLMNTSYCRGVKEGMRREQAKQKTSAADAYQRGVEFAVGRLLVAGKI